MSSIKTSGHERRAPASDSENPSMDDVIAEKLFVERQETAARQCGHFQVGDPLYEELLSDERGPDCVLYYGHNDLDCDGRDEGIPAAAIYRPYAKKFGHRYVAEEERVELCTLPVIPTTNAWEQPRGGVGNYPTMRMILRPDNLAGAPPMIGEGPWIMHPRWREAFLDAAVKLAEQSLDLSPDNVWGNTWGLWAGDEVFEASGIRVVPREKRDETVEAIDREVRERFGFGKYGMPDSEDDENPFKRIAYRRWVNAALTERFRTAYGLVKKINPKLVMLGPDPCGAVPPVDLEAMTSCFDIMSNQSWCAPTPFVQQLATGADTKAMVDLSDCPVWALAQHAAIETPEGLREQYSQVYRNGGEGLIALAVEWYDRELEHPKFINTAKWRALLEIVQNTTKMKRVKLPQPDTAVLYASDTYLTWKVPKMVHPEYPQMYSAYAALGPLTGSWFSFVSDRQIDRGTRKLSDYKVLYIPLATYQRGAVLDKIEEYVKEGGIVVCTDPTAFTWDITGDDLSARWAEITGVKQGDTRSGTTEALVTDAEFLRDTGELMLNFSAPGVRCSPADACTGPLAVFSDGSLAAAIRRCGKGQVISFASDLFAWRDLNASAADLVRRIQISAGARTDQDIWRFKLPPFETVYVNDPATHRCLTNNHVERTFTMERDGVTSAHNVPIAGTYTYDRFPTRIADAADTGEIAFEDGHLTNRREAYTGRLIGGGRRPPELEKWIVSWSDPDAVALTVDLKRAYSLDRIVLFYSGVLPRVTVAGSTDSRTWSVLGALPPQAETSDVIDVTLPVKHGCRYLKLGFAARKTHAVMELCEMEIWGEA